MSIEIIDKTHAKLIVNIGSGQDRIRKTKKVEYSGKKDLQEQYNDFVLKIKSESTSNLSVEELVKSYIYQREMLGTKETTIVGYNVALKRIIFRFKSISATSLTTYHIEQFVVEMANKGYSPKTIKNTISLLNSSYKRGVKTGLLKTNPCENVSMPKQAQKEIKTFSEEEVYRFYEALGKYRLDFKVAYELALFCGLRRSEILGLTEEDINLDFKMISINKSRHLIKGKEVIQEPKTKRSKRTLAIPDFIAYDIQQLELEHKSLPMKHSNFLILTGHGEKMHPATLTNRLNGIEAENDLPNITLHGLRHTFATMLNADGVDIARISAELGHSSIGVTVNRYTHVFGNVTSSSRGIADKFNEKMALNCHPEQNKTPETL